MFQWFRQMSVIARLRGLALLAVVAMLALSSSLLWTSYKQRLADRQVAASQRVELAHASVQWAYARQQFGKLNATQARQHTLEILDRLKRGKAADSATADVHTSMVGQSAVTLGAVLLVSALLWACFEITARDLGEAQARRQAPAPRGKGDTRGPQAYRQGPAPPAATSPVSAGAVTPADDPADPNEAAAQEVKRLRMAGAI